MCGIFGIISEGKISNSAVRLLANHARQRGRDSSGLIYQQDKDCQVRRADYDIKNLLSNTKPYFSPFVFGHSRLITNGLGDNQPVVRGDILVIHNGIIVNDDAVWDGLGAQRHLKIDSEVIAAITELHLKDGNDLSILSEAVLSRCRGTISTAVILPKQGKAVLFSNNGSLYIGSDNHAFYFSSESYPLTRLGCSDVRQIKEQAHIVDIPKCEQIFVSDERERTEDLIPEFKFIRSEAELLEYEKPQLRRCTKCILPETMPFISFDEHGVCNYCRNYKSRNKPKPKEELFALVEPYRKKNGLDCIVPFSGGRDSCYGLHLIVNELKMKPVTYTYDWGMVTDLGRRNISRMCARLGVENIANSISKCNSTELVRGQAAVA